MRTSSNSISDRAIERRATRLPHAWRLNAAGTPGDVVRDFIQPAIRAVPSALVRRLPRCEISLPIQLEGDAASQWSINAGHLEIAVAREGVEPHDLAVDVLVCVGQILWEFLDPAERSEWLMALRTELQNAASGEIDEPAVAQKRKLLSSPAAARRPRQLTEYARTSFGGTVAEYVHSLWHDVTVRTGADHLDPKWLRRRFDLLHRWFPPDRGYRLFPPRAI